jgi:UDP-N-acetylglucosamine transferase subunit ALG13
MIFVTVGEQLPFDRLIKAIDEWTKSSTKKVFAQIGKSKFKPRYIDSLKFLTPQEFTDKLQKCEVIISHAGMGTIISAIDIGKPIVIVPRKASLGEHRNDHQFFTAKKFSSLSNVTVAFDENELIEKLKDLNKILQSNRCIVPNGPSELLLKTIKDFL